MQATDVITAPQSLEDPAALPAAEARLQRNLKIVVIALAVVIFAGLTAIIGRVIYLASASATQPVSRNAAIGAEQSLMLPAGAQVRSVSLSGNRLAVHYEAAGTEGVAVLDLQTGQTVTSVGIERKVPAN